MNSFSLIGLGNHLWQSTLFAAAVGCLTLMLRHNSARVRYLLWLAASCKFLVPFALLSAVGARLPSPLGQSQAGHALSSVGQMALHFTPFSGAAATPLATHAVPGAAVLIALEALWLLGTLALLARVLSQWLQVRRALHQSTPTGQAFLVPVHASSSQLEPAIVGIVHPVLLLPQGLEQRLAPEEIRAVLAHERCHVAWKDNLAAALHMLVEALFWFHPLIWWLGARLVVERERACDEQVLADGHSPLCYAEGILKVCEHYLGSRLACVAGVSGADLRQRIEVIMRNPIIEKLGSLRKLVIIVTAAATVLAPIAVGVLAAPRARAQGGTPAGEEPNVSIQLWRADGTNPPAIAGSPDRWVLQFHASLRSLIASAYGVSESQVVGRDWSNAPIYQISADGPPSLLQPGNTMMRDLMAKHFGLVVKVERKVLPGYVLRVSSGGMKLTPSAPGPGNGSFSPNGVDMSHFPVGSLVTYLQTIDELGAPVVDETGLQGNYDYKVSWQLPAPGAATDPAAVTKALAEQLGLSLEARPVNVDVISVISVKSPQDVVTANLLTPNFIEAPINRVAQAVALATHKTIILDPRADFNVTLLNFKPISPTQFLQAFLSTLAQHGFVAVPTAPEVIKIVRDTELAVR